LFTYTFTGTLLGLVLSLLYTLAILLFFVLSEIRWSGVAGLGGCRRRHFIVRR
jgi:hypothetical protein